MSYVIGFCSSFLHMVPAWYVYARYNSISYCMVQHIRLWYVYNFEWISAAWFNVIFACVIPFSKLFKILCNMPPSIIGWKGEMHFVLQLTFHSGWMWDGKGGFSSAYSSYLFTSNIPFNFEVCYLYRFDLLLLNSFVPVGDDILHLYSWNYLEI